MSVVLLALLLATSASVAPSPQRAPSPDEEVEAWDPIGNTIGVPARAARDDDAQALAAVLPVVGGVAFGTAVACAAVYVAGVLPGGGLAAVAIAALAFVATPSVAVAVFVPDLPGWTPVLTAVLVPVGGAALGVAALLTSFVLLAREDTPGSDCGGCGPTGLVVLAGIPVAAAAGGIVGGLTATTIAAYAAHE